MNLLLFDIGNTHTHLGLANARRVFRQVNLPTTAWLDGTADQLVRQFAGKTQLTGAAIVLSPGKTNAFIYFQF